MNTVAFIRQAQLRWFERMRPHLMGTNLNVGSGHGFFSQAARDAGLGMTSLEVAAPDAAVDRERIVLYDGGRMPFEDGAFDVSLAMYVLHHTPDPAAVLAEMKRVSRRRILIVEELYRHFPGKLHLALLDAWVNVRGGLKSKIRWGSYLDRPRLMALAEAGGWSVAELQSTPNAGFDEVLWVIERG